MTELEQQIRELAGELLRFPALVLSGAGISTDSGIPDYRSKESLARNRTPMTFQRFSRSADERRHYWARSHAGWLHMRQVEPNAGHEAVARLEAAGLVTGVLTQNVDGLHQRAGSKEVLELHGSLATVRCLNCGQTEPMRQFQERLAELNPDFSQADARLNPDGDVELEPGQTADFTVADCLNCAGVMKTDVVYFGENVPAARVDRAFQMLADADSVLVLGSSLAVRSGLRFAERAHAGNKPVFIINDGPTRADGIAQLKLEGRLGELLPELLHQAEQLVAGKHT